MPDDDIRLTLLGVGGMNSPIYAPAGLQDWGNADRVGAGVPRVPVWARKADLMFAEAAGWDRPIRFAHGAGGHA